MVESWINDQEKKDKFKSAKQEFDELKERNTELLEMNNELLEEMIDFVETCEGDGLINPNFTICESVRSL